jgi:hypothetical protein
MLVAAVEASDGRRRRRKRNTTPDAMGLDVKRDLLARIADADPEPYELEAFLLAQVLAAPASGPVRALASEILEEYQLAQVDPEFGGWIAAGAPSEDAFPGDDQLFGGRRGRSNEGEEKEPAQ